MKTFIWINGTEAKIINRETLEEAVETAENYSDHSDEIIVREVDFIDDFRTKRETFHEGFYNIELNNDISKIKEIQKDLFSQDSQLISVSESNDFNLDVPFAIDVEGDSYFYHNKIDRRKDFLKLCGILGLELDK